jgi:hypothetical protein
MTMRLAACRRKPAISDRAAASHHHRLRIKTSPLALAMARATSMRWCMFDKKACRRVIKAT